MRDANRGPAEVGYIVMGYPRLSESFISNEILQLERLGTRVRVYAVKAGGEDRVHDSVKAIRAPVSYLPRMTSLSGTSLPAWLRDNLTAYRAAHGRLLRTEPVRYLGALVSALAMSVRYSERPFALRKVFIKEFLQAGFIADAINSAPGVGHLHGHFCHGATTITWFVSRLTRIPFSFTAHAKDIYLSSQNPGNLLVRKLDAARFAVTCTHANREHMLSHVHPGRPACTILHGVDTDYFAPRMPSADDSGIPLILAVGRFVEKKGFAYLIDACADLRNRGMAFRCRLVGEAGDQLPMLKARIALHRLEGHVEINGPATHHELKELYAQAAMFALPCVVADNGDRDGIPNVLAEAMSMGLAVVTTAVSGIGEIVENGRNGLVVQERDSAALTQALATLVADPAHRRRLGAAARATICAVFDSRQTTRQLKGLFDEALAAEARSWQGTTAEPVSR